ncbi:MAG: hypothetical protein WC141_01565 [Arcobacteraceae bacterium]
MSKIKRRMLYVDATGYKDNTEFKISLYDPEINLTNILALKDISTSNEAEKYAILYGILYSVKSNLKSVHILCDNQNATESKELRELAAYASIRILWIPRELNTIADKIAKLEPTVKEKEWYLLHFIYKNLRV